LNFSLAENGKDKRVNIVIETGVYRVIDEIGRWSTMDVC
jgi:hypothetical protein